MTEKLTKQGVRDLNLVGPRPKPKAVRPPDCFFGLHVWSVWRNTQMGMYAERSCLRCPAKEFYGEGD